MTPARTADPPPLGPREILGVPALPPGAVTGVAERLRAAVAELRALGTAAGLRPATTTRLASGDRAHLFEPA